MAHINHSRVIREIESLSIDMAISEYVYNNSFAAFGGSKVQRDSIGLYEISRVFGKIGIVLVHNDPIFEASLGQVYAINPSIPQGTDVPKMYLANSGGALKSFYDPLYGLAANKIIEAIIPFSSDSHRMFEAQELRSALSDYLSIMAYRYKDYKNVFGKYPYNLDLLYALTEMTVPELEQKVLKFLPEKLHAQLYTRLSSDGVQPKVFNAVRSFAAALEASLWYRKNPSSHSRLSIIEAVASRNLISIYVPGSKKEILDYLAVELTSLNENEEKTPYLLVASDIALNNSSEFKKLFLNQHAALPYSTGILSENLGGIVNNTGTPEGGSAEITCLFGEVNELFVFKCSSALAAEPFSRALGNYYRMVNEEHWDSHRQPFHIFSSEGHGGHKVEAMQANINPEELTRYENGCLIYGRNHSIPLLVHDFKIPARR